MCTYFTGYLDLERMYAPKSETCQVADFAYSLMQEGKVHLTQRRMSPPVAHNKEINWVWGIGQGFEYIATGATPRPKPARSLIKELMAR
jgi:elongation factor P hydroxylase